MNKLLIGGLYFFTSTIFAADMALYPTGPSQDSSFVRFVNGIDQDLDIVAAGSNSKVGLSTTKPATNFYAIAANKEIKGKFVGGSINSDISLKVKPGEFASAIIIKVDNKPKQVIVRETPEDFSSLKASVALYNLAEKQCNLASLSVVGKGVNLVEKVSLNQSVRRSLNPINISVQLVCDGKSLGSPLSLGNLQAGKRYTVFAFAGAKEPQMSFAEDTLQ